MAEDKHRVLLVEDDRTMAAVYMKYLESERYEVTHVETGAEGLRAIDAQGPDAVLLDLKLPDMDGMALLRRIAEGDSGPPVIVITADGSLNTAVEAMREGAVDFLAKPFGADRLRVTLRNALDRGRLTAKVRTLENEATRDRYRGFIGRSPLMQAVYKMIDRAGPSKATVFITGESGTGKEICAQAIHAQSPRRDGPLIAINCGAIPRDLMESEIFGHVKGAFTGAVRDRDGAAALADGGTLFLDEICEMDLDLQTKLLRFIQTGCLHPVGGSRTRSVDVRFVCATNRDPLREVEVGRFREDLYYRLHVIPIHMPPLRDRGEDILLIARAFLSSFANEEGRALRALDAETEAIIQTFSWPGNVRQLQNVIRNIVVLNDGDRVTREMLPAPLDRMAYGDPNPAAPSVEPHEIAREPDPSPPARSVRDIIPITHLERQAIETAIDICDGSVPSAAHYLGISAATIYRKRTQWRSEASGA